LEQSKTFPAQADDHDARIAALEELVADLAARPDSPTAAQPFSLKKKKKWAALHIFLRATYKECAGGA
jgi:hypothetical protein